MKIWRGSWRLYGILAGQRLPGCFHQWRWLQTPCPKALKTSRTSARPTAASFNSSSSSTSHSSSWFSSNWAATASKPEAPASPSCSGPLSSNWWRRPSITMHLGTLWRCARTSSKWQKSNLSSQKISSRLCKWIKRGCSSRWVAAWAKRRTRSKRIYR